SARTSECQADCACSGGATRGEDKRNARSIIDSKWRGWIRANTGGQSAYRNLHCTGKTILRNDTYGDGTTRASLRDRHARRRNGKCETRWRRWRRLNQCLPTSTTSRERYKQTGEQNEGDGAQAAGLPRPAVETSHVKAPKN